MRSATGMQHQSASRRSFIAHSLLSISTPAMTHYDAGSRPRKTVMFAAPPQLETEVFARLPEEFRKPPRPSLLAEWQPGHVPGTILEGPAFDLDGNLYVVDVPFGRIFRVDPRGNFTKIADYDGEPQGLKIHKDGRLFVADFKYGIVTIDPDSGRVTPVLERYRLEHLKAPNDLIFASNGDLYFTDQGLTGLQDPSGRLFRIRADGQVDCILDNVPSPNGLVLDLSEQFVFLAVTRANAIWRVPLTHDGGTTKVGTFIQMSGGVGPDGMAIDQAGNIAVAHVGFGTVWLFSNLGEPLYRIKSCAGLTTTNVAYGGPDRKTLYITEAATASILRVKLDVPGRLMFSHM